MFVGIVSVLFAINFSRVFAISGGIYNAKWDATPECQRDLEKVVHGAINGEFWALKILDASTKVPSGILTGHFIDYGNYDECLEIGENLQTQFCTATINPPSYVINQITGNESSLISSVAFRWSYCIPASCPPQFLQNALQNVLKDVDCNVTVDSKDCETNNRKYVASVDYIGIAIWALFITLAVLSTIYDVAFHIMNLETNPWMTSFSIYTNGKSLLKTSTTADTMVPLHGIRFLSICWVILGHRYFFSATSSLINLTDFGKEMEKLESQLFVQGVLAVDTFFLLSGLLNSFYLMKVLDKSRRFPVVMYYLHRYIRLTPALAAVVLMYATWFSYIGDGPAWNQTAPLWKQLCVDNWWPTLLYINNYYNPITQCAGQSWYLAVDMQLYWFSPLVMIPLWKWPRFGKAYLCTLLVVSTIAQFVIAYVYQFRMFFTFGLNVAELEKVTKMIYVPTHMRATPYVIGLMTGYYLYYLHKYKTSLFLSKVMIISGWLLSTVLCLAVLLGNFQFSRPIEQHPYNKWESSFYISLHRIGWGVGISWVIIACLNGYGGIINTLLSWRAFIPLSKLTYCIFLSHMAIQQYQVGTTRTSDYFQHFNQVHRYFGDLIMSVISGGALSLIFESPILVLEKLSMRKREKPVRKEEFSNGGFQDDLNS